MIKNKYSVLVAVAVQLLFSTASLASANDSSSAQSENDVCQINDYYLIASRNYKLNEVTPEDVIKLYKRKSYNLKGVAAVPLHLPPSLEDRRIFSEKVLKWPKLIREIEINRLLKFKNDSVLVEEIQSLEKVFDRISTSENSIGYISSKDAYRVPSNLKLISIKCTKSP